MVPETKILIMCLSLVLTPLRLLPSKRNTKPLNGSKRPTFAGADKLALGRAAACEKTVPRRFFFFGSTWREWAKREGAVVQCSSARVCR